MGTHPPRARPSCAPRGELPGTRGTRAGRSIGARAGVGTRSRKRCNAAPARGCARSTRDRRGPRERDVSPPWPGSRSRRVRRLPQARRRPRIGSPPRRQRPAASLGRTRRTDRRRFRRRRPLRRTGRDRSGRPPVSQCFPRTEAELSDGLSAGYGRILRARPRAETWGARPVRSGPGRNQVRVEHDDNEI